MQPHHYVDRTPMRYAGDWRADFSPFFEKFTECRDRLAPVGAGYSCRMDASGKRFGVTFRSEPRTSLHTLTVDLETIVPDFAFADPENGWVH
jgi:hypothetical protein